ncbi:MAG: tRNA modification GTPase [Planctomycetota bacterium]
MAATGGPAHDVIVAQATAPGRSAMAVVRASGERADELLRRVDARMPAGVMVRGVRAGEIAIAAGSLPCLVASMPAPGSYTGEQAFELIVPGHPEVVRLVIEALCAVPGVRRAGPGEFTLRAFESGRLTLEQAEGVAATIAARTDAELRAAAWMRAGGVGSRVASVNEAVGDLLALVEAGIDFTDQEDVVAIDRATLCEGLRTACDSLQSLVDGSVPLERLENAPMVVLTGPPNAGKSALFNALLGRSRAVVADVAGTTRDALVEPWRVRTPGGVVEVLLVDLPGEMCGARGLDALGQHMRELALRRACITVHCAPDAHDAAPALPDTLRARTKCDDDAPAAPGAIATSARTGRGLAELARAVANLALGLGATPSGEGLALASRHRSLLAEAIAHLRAALGAASVGTDRVMAHPELVAAALHGALESLGGIAGRLAPDDILGRIFGRFCVGK